jgi:ribonuclease P protein component
MLPRKYKLKRDNDFKRVFKQGKYQQKDFIRLRFLKNNLKISRFAFVIGLKISKKATQRNRIRRQLEEIIRLSFDQIKPSFDVVILAEKEIINKKYQEIETTLMGLLKEAKLVK